MIDYGNGFKMQEGVTVKEGLTGWKNLLPPEFRSGWFKSYNPFGINAYQFARNALFICFLTEFKSIEVVHEKPTVELNELRKKEEYPSELCEWL